MGERPCFAVPFAAFCRAAFRRLGEAGRCAVLFRMCFKGFAGMFHCRHEVKKKIFCFGFYPTCRIFASSNSRCRAPGISGKGAQWCTIGKMLNEYP